MTRPIRLLPLALAGLLATAVATGTPSVAQESDQNSMGLGTEDRTWDPGPLPDPTPPERFSFETMENVKIPMRDGVLLDALIYLPDVDETPPCIDARGSSGENASEGEPGLYNEFGRDGYDIVEWMADQEWCNGNVGAFGSSLPGIPLWQIAKEEPPSLKAIAPDVACGDCYEYLWYPGGMLPGPGRASRAEHEYLDAIEHQDFDEWWRDRSTIAEDHAAIAESGIAIMASGGWEDYITAGNVQAFSEFAAAGGNGKLMISPGAHSGARNAVLGPHHHAQHMDLFFDHFLDYLSGHGNQWTDDDVYQGDVLIWVNGPDQYRWEDTWPIPDAREAQLHLREPASGSIDSLNDGSLRAAGAASGEADFSYGYDPEDGPFLRTMRQSGQGITSVDQRPYEGETLTWTTDVLDAPTEVTGKVEFDFWASADTEDTDFVLMVSDVAPDGTSTYVTSGYLNAPRNDSRSVPNPLVPGEIRNYHLDTQATSYVFQEGHRVRISLAGGTAPAPEQTSPQGPGLNLNPATVTIYQDAERPSSVVLPVIGTALFPTESFDGLRQLVDELVGIGAIDDGRERQLHAKIDRAERLADRSANQADAQLRAFQRQVDGFTPRFIDPEAAERLTTEAERLRSLL